MTTYTKALVLVFVAVGMISHAQEYKKTIETEFGDYINSIVNKDFEKSTNYMIPEFFDLIPKSQMIAVMEETFNDPEIEIQIKNPKIIEIKDSKKIGNKHYALLSYSNVMTMKFIDTPDENVEQSAEDLETKMEEIKSRNNLTRESLESSFGKENVTYDPQNSFFSIFSKKNVYAVSDNGSSGWKFVVIEKKQLPLLKKILPKELTDKI